MSKWNKNIDLETCGIRRIRFRNIQRLKIIMYVATSYDVVGRLYRWTTSWSHHVIVISRRTTSSSDAIGDNFIKFPNIIN